MPDSREAQDLVAQDHPLAAHAMVLAYGVALDVVQAVQVENHQVHHAWEVHSNPDEVHATEVPGTESNSPKQID